MKQLFLFIVLIKSFSTLFAQSNPPVNDCSEKGSPTVVLISGAGDFSFDWTLVQPKVARFSTICSYDRAGFAWSDLGPVPRTMRQEVYELHELLSKAGHKGP